MEQLESSGRLELASLVFSEGRKIPFVTEVYIREVALPTNRFISNAAAVALARGELSDDFLVHVPQFLTSPFWMVLIENKFLQAGGGIPASEFLSRQIDLVFGPCRAP
jgi:hypothetical protein